MARKARTRKLPLRSCSLCAGWRETGRARLLVVREQRDGRFLVGRFEVDLWCLGLLSAQVCKDVSLEALAAMRRETFGRETPAACRPELAAAVVYGGIEYASRIGFAPHPAWEMAQYVLPPPRDARRITVEFGRDGKPCYVAGAADDDAVLEALEERLGPDAFHILLPA